MEDSVRNDLFKIIEKVHQKHPNGFMILIGMGKCSDVVNYLIDKGKIEERIRNDCYTYIANYFYNRYAGGQPLHIRDTWAELLIERKRTYEFNNEVYPYLP